MAEPLRAKLHSMWLKPRRRYRWPNKTFYCDRMTAPDPIRPICPICQTPLARERQTRTMQPDITQTAVTEKEFDVWVCPKDRSHEPELHITDV